MNCSRCLRNLFTPIDINFYEALDVNKKNVIQAVDGSVLNHTTSLKGGMLALYLKITNSVMTLLHFSVKTGPAGKGVMPGALHFLIFVQQNKNLEVSVLIRSL